MAQRKVRYAVVGLGHIAQVAVLPAFQHANENSELVALISGNPTKLRKLAKKYKVDFTASYDAYEKILTESQADAVYIALPNALHAEFTIRAAELGLHVLCEKPLATSEKDCAAMIESTQKNNVKLMTAYRLHFDPAHLKAVEIAESGKLGDLRFFSSIFSMQARVGNIRLDRELGGGPLFDLGIYCINAARYLFRSEPQAVMAIISTSADPRFSEVEETVSAVIKFPGERLATFTASFGAANTGSFQVVGTKGSLSMDPAYEYAEALEYNLKVGERESIKRFKKEDQFAPELVYFSECILKNHLIEPSGLEGLCDVRIIEAIFESARTGQKVNLATCEKTLRPEPSQKIKKPAVREPDLIQAEEPSL